MSIRIQISSTDLRDREVTQRSTGKVFRFKEQTAWAYTTDDKGVANPHPERIAVTLPRGRDEAYPEGDYTVHPASFYRGNFDSLEFSLRLAPVKARS